MSPLRSKFDRHSHPALSAALAALVPVEDLLTSLSPLKLLTLDPLRINGKGIYIFLSLDRVGE